MRTSLGLLCSSLLICSPAEAAAPFSSNLPTAAHDEAHRLSRFSIPRLRYFPQMVTPPFHIAVVKEHIYVNTGSSAYPLFRMPRPGGRMTQLLPGFRKIVGSFVFWRGRIVFKTSTAIWSVDPSGGKPRLELPLRDTLGLRVHAGRLYRTKFRGRLIEEIVIGKSRPRRIARLPSSPGTLAFDGSHIFTSLYGRGQVLRVDQRGRSKTIARGQRTVTDVAVLGDYIYWSVETKGGQIRRRKKTGRGKIEVVARRQVNAECFAVHGGALYWRNWSGGSGKHTIMRYDPIRGTITTAVGGLSSPAYVAFDDKYIYVSDKGTGSIVRARKPADVLAKPR